MKESQEISAILEYFHSMIGSTAEAWSYCSSRWDSDMLQHSAGISWKLIVTQLAKKFLAS
jgi:hypothetical protein